MVSISRQKEWDRAQSGGSNPPAASYFLSLFCAFHKSPLKFCLTFTLEFCGLFHNFLHLSTLRAASRKMIVTWIEQFRLLFNRQQVKRLPPTKTPLSRVTPIRHPLKITASIKSRRLPVWDSCYYWNPVIICPGSQRIIWGKAMHSPSAIKMRKTNGNTPRIISPVVTPRDGSAAPRR